MTSQINSQPKVPKEQSAPSAARSRRLNRVTKSRLIARIRVKSSDIPIQEKDKLLFEVFDLLLRNRNPIEGLSPAGLASAVKKSTVETQAPSHGHARHI